VLTALVLAIALGGSLWFLDGSIGRAATQQIRVGLRVDQVIATSGPGLPPGLARVLSVSPGVAAATGVVRSTMLDDEGSAYTAEGVDPRAVARTIDLGVTSGSLAGLDRRTVAVDTVTASDLNLRVGGVFRGWFGDGAPARLRIVAIYRRGLGFASFTLAAGALRPHTQGLDSTVLVTDSPGAHASVVRVLLHAINKFSPGAMILTRRGYQAVLGTTIAENTWTIHALVSVLLIYVGIAAVNTLVMATSARRRELGVLRLVGIAPSQLLRMICVEQAVLLGLALVVGGAIAGATLIPLVKGTTGSSAVYVPPSGWLTVILGTVALGLSATILPMRRLLRIPPNEAVGAVE
jgi:putative ABC transport system permease protein